MSTIRIKNEDKYERHFKYLKDQNIPVPPMDIQLKIVKECEAIDSEFKKIKEEISSYNKMINDIYDNSVNKANFTVRLDDRSKFKLSIGNRVLKSELKEDGNIHVISANVNEILNKSKSVSMIDLFNDKITRWFVSKYEMYDSEKKHHESDLIIFDKQKKEIFLFEIKHSAENTPKQTQHLENKEFLNKIKDSFGKIAGRYVLYNGNNDFSTEIPRISAVDFLNTIYQLKKENIIDINLSIQKIKDKSQQFSKSEDINKPTKKRKDSEWE